MKNKTVLITGATDGVGRIAAEKIAALGARVLIHGRSKDKISRVVSEIKEATGNSEVQGYQADLSSFTQIKTMTDKVINDHSKLDVLINNAGVLGPNDPDAKPVITEDGHELIFQVNYLATALYCERLLPLLEKAEGRIINLASAAQSPIDFENLGLIGGMTSYAKSKLAVVIFSMFYAERIKSKKVSVNSLDPGSLLNTNMVKEAFGESERSPSIGADAEVFLASSAELDGVSGEYFCEGKLARAHEQAYDKSAQDSLWALTEKLVF